MLDDIVPAIEGVMTVLPEPVQRPRNPEVRIRLSINTMELGPVEWDVSSVFVLGDIFPCESD